MSKSDRFTRESKKIAKATSVPLSVAKRLHAAELEGHASQNDSEVQSVTPRIQVAANHYRPVAWSAGIGVDGTVEVIDIGADLNRPPHLLVVGSAGSGKTRALRVMLAQLETKNVPPEVWKFAPEWADPISSILITKLSECGLYGSDDRFVEFIADARAEVLARCENRAGHPRSPLVIVVDGVDACLGDDREHPALAPLVDIARMGRAANVHLVVTAQRAVPPVSGLVPDTLTVVCGRVSAFDEKILGIGEDIELYDRTHHIRTGGQWKEVAPLVPN